MNPKLFFTAQLIFIFSFSLRAQNNYYLDFSGSKAFNSQQPLRRVDDKSVQNYWAISGADYMLPLSTVNSQLYTIGFASGFNNAMAVGLDRFGEATSDEFTFPFVTYLSYHYLMPQEISTANDSLHMKLNGYNCQFDFLGLDYLKSDHALLTAGIAWAFGRLKATETSVAGKTIFINSYFAPEL